MANAPNQQAFAIGNGGASLVRFDTGEPGTTTSLAITGLGGDQTLVGIDFRPSNGQLYGLAVRQQTTTFFDISGNVVLVPTPGTGLGTLYVIDRQTGFTTVVGNYDGLGNLGTIADTYGFDVNPLADRIRITNESGLDIRVNPNTGAVVTDPVVNSGPTGVSAVAYTQNVVGGLTTTTLYALGATSDSLYVQNPPDFGNETLVGPLGIDFTGANGFDIPANTSGYGFANLTVGGTAGLYEINLATGAATLVGAIGSGGAALSGLALGVAPPVPPPPVLDLPAVAIGNGGASLVFFNTGMPGTATTLSITGLATGQALVGIDVRPANGSLYALAIRPQLAPSSPDPTAPPMQVPNTGLGTLYLIDPRTGVASVVGNQDGLGNLIVNADSYGFDFNPVTDLIRITNEAGINIRVSPNTGLVTFTDVTNTGVSAVAYTQIAGPGGTTTTLYALDATSDSLSIQNANAGTETLIGPLGIDFTSANGFDIPANTSGYGLANLTVGGVASLYQINLTTGAATIVGPIGNAGVALSGLALLNSPPVIVSDGGGAAGAVSRAENGTAVTTVAATDLNGQTPSYDIAGGADAAKFAIDPTTGALAFVAAPNFEAPGSAAGTNVYAVTVRASDGRGGEDSQALSVTVTDVNDVAPVITTAAAVSVAENTTFVAALTATDVDTVGTNPPLFSITGGADAALFQIVGSELRFVSPRDFETQAHGYSVEVTANDGANVSSKLIGVTLTDVPETTPPPATPAAPVLASDTGVAGDRITSSAEIVYPNPAPGNTLLYSLDGTTFTATAPSFGADGAYTVSIEERDGAGNVSAPSSLGFTLDRTPPSAPSARLVNDTGLSATDGITRDPLLAYTADADATLLYSVNGGGYASTAPVFGADGTYAIRVRATDVAGNVMDGTSNTTVFLDRTPPSVSLTGADGAARTVSGSVGLGDAGAAVTVYEGSTVLGSGVVGADGGWSVPLTAANGRHAVTAQVADLAGNLGISSALALTLVSVDRSLFGTVVTDASGPAGALYQLYDGLLARAPDPLGFEAWLDGLAHGLTLRDVAQAFLLSPEYVRAHGPVAAETNAGFVDELYHAALARSGEPVGTAGWIGGLDAGLSRADVALAFSVSTENLAQTRGALGTGVFAPDLAASDAARLYYGLLDRAPDAAGLVDWTAFLHAGHSVAEAAQGFLDSTEYKTAFGQLGNAAFVDALYDGALGRDPEPNASAAWEAALAAGRSRADVAAAISESQEAKLFHLPDIEAGWHIA